MTQTVRICDVTKRYGTRQAVPTVLLRARRKARLVALVGHNGAGKTTLMKLMLGLDPADRRLHRGARRQSRRRRIRRPPAVSAICRRTSPSTPP